MGVKFKFDQSKILLKTTVMNKLSDCCCFTISPFFSLAVIYESVPRDLQLHFNLVERGLIPIVVWKTDLGFFYFIFIARTALVFELAQSLFAGPATQRK